MIVGGTQAGDGYSLVKGLVQAGYSPKFLWEANGPNSPGEFPGKVGPSNTQGIFSSSDWFPKAKTYGNPYFVKLFTKTYHVRAGAIDPGSAEAYAVGQIAERVVRRVGLSNSRIIAALHKGHWPSVEGNLHWNAIGEPTGNFLLVEWLGGNLYPVLPKKAARHKPVFPKPDWGS